MQPIDPRAELRATLASFDERQKKIVGAMIVVMIESPERVKKREWVSQQFTEVVLLTGDYKGAESVDEGVSLVQAYARENIDAILNASYLLFQLTAEDLASKLDQGVTREQAVTHAMGYMVATPE
jgi:hypothetical protein